MIALKKISNEKKVKQPSAKKRKISQEEVKFKHKFYELMFELDLYNKFKKTYFLQIIKETNYGFYAHLYLSPGMSFDSMQGKKDTIEQNLQCLWIMKMEPFRKYAEVQVVLKAVDKSIEYVNPQIEPHELYLGLSFSNQLQKNNNNDNCMFLLAGATGSGKTRYIYQVLLSWISSCSPDEVWIYLSDIAKNEYIQFKNVKHVKYYASESDELYSMMRNVSKEFERRKQLISKYREKGVATNISEYNKINKSKKLPYCYVLIDEFSVLTPDKTDSKAEKEQKEFILDMLKRLSKLGRSLGILIFIATQKTTRDEIPSILKNMSAVRISFRANDTISSEVIMGNNIAMGLPERVAVYSLNGGSTQNYLYAPTLTMPMLNELLEPHMRSGQIDCLKRSTLQNSDATTTSFKMTRIPKGVSYKEFFRSHKEDSYNKEDEYNDY